MLFAPLASLLALAFAGMAISQDATAGQPQCFLDCAQTASTALGCTGATDFACYCTQQQFMVDNARCTIQQCPDLALNNSVITTSFAQLEAVCRAATGSFNLTIPSAAELGAGNETSTSTAAGTAPTSNAPSSTGTTSRPVSTSTTRTSSTGAASTSTSSQNGAITFSITPMAMGISLLAAGFAVLA